MQVCLGAWTIVLFTYRRPNILAFLRDASASSVRGSLVGTRQDMAEALAFAAEGKVKADIELQTLSAINQVLHRLERGEVAARVVLEFADS